MNTELPSGYRIVFKHWRVPDSWWWNQGRNVRLYPGHPRLIHYGQPHGFIPAPYGGYTECYIYDANRELVANEYALCSIKDQFVYKIGRQISLGRALKHLWGE